MAKGLVLGLLADQDPFLRLRRVLLSISVCNCCKGWFRQSWCRAGAAADAATGVAAGTGSDITCAGKLPCSSFNLPCCSLQVGNLRGDDLRSFLQLAVFSELPEDF